MNPVQQAFNADLGKVRAIFLASAACDECVHGVIRLQRSWLDRDRRSNVKVYLVWSSQRGASQQDALSAKRLVRDDRVQHFWDSRQQVGRAYQAPLGLCAPAWDVWMLFDTETWWGESPPAPVWWEHQLCEGPPERWLDPDRFRVRAASLDGDGAFRMATGA
jgi:hypothetical protein